MTLRCDPSKKYLTDIKPSNGGARKRVSGAKFQEVFVVLFLDFSIQTIQYSCVFSMSLSEYVRRERLDLLDHQESIETIGVINVEGHLINLMVPSY